MTDLKVAIFRNDGSVFQIGNRTDVAIGRSVRQRELCRMDDLVAVVCQTMCQSKRQLRIDEKPHAAVSATARRTPEARAPYSNAAKRSSGSRSA